MAQSGAMTEPADPLAPLRAFVGLATACVARGADEATVLAELQPALAALVSRDDWLPAALAQPDPVHYRQYLLHADALERFSVVSFVWGPGQFTPVHDHTVWGLIGMLRGEEVSQRWGFDAGGRWQAMGAPHTLQPGQVEAVSPRLGDVHQVRNASATETAISIHVYGANIGAVRRHVFDAEGRTKPFVSGYSNDWLPNLWDRSAQVRAGG